jgi:hypothetical protein
VEDREGTLWIGFWQNGLARYRDGRFESIAAPQGPVESLCLDSSGVIYGTAQRGGVFRIDDASGQHPVLHYLGEGKELAASVPNCVTGDSTRRLYVGTFGGIFRLDARTGEETRFTTRDRSCCELRTTPKPVEGHGLASMRAPGAWAIACGSIQHRVRRRSNSARLRNGCFVLEADDSLDFDKSWRTTRADKRTEKTRRRPHLGNTRSKLRI